MAAALAISAAAVGDPALGEVVRRKLHGNRVAAQDADVVLAHLAGNMCGDDVPVLQPHAESCVGQRLDDGAFHFDVVFFGHVVR